MQELTVALIVAACTVYATWSLMPSGWRRSLAQRIQHWPLPGVLSKHVRKAAASGGCGCDAGCDAKSPASPGAGPQPIRFHRRPPKA